MALAIYTSAAWTSNGGLKVAGAATIEVRRESDGALATIYSDRAGTAPITNPSQFGDASGRFQFFAAGGAYRVKVTQDGEEHELRWQAIGTAGEFDTGTGANDVPANSDINARGFAQSVDSVSTLRTSTFPASLERLWLSGYYGVGTAGGGPLYRDSDDTVSADNGGTVFVDWGGVRWKRPVASRVDAAQFGAREGVGNDSASSLNQMFLHTGAVRIDGDFHAFGTVSVENKKLDVEGTGSITFHGAGSYFRAINNDFISVPGEDLVSLPKKGDNAILLPSSISDPSLYYCVLVSDEIETYRRNQGAALYTKNECLDIINGAGAARSPVRLDYSSATDLTVRLHRKDRSVNWRGVKISASSGDEDTRSDLFFLSGFYGGNISPNADATAHDGLTNAVMRLSNSCAIKIQGGILRGTSQPGASYGVLSNNCAHITYENVSLNDTQGADHRLSYAARHCSNIYFNGCGFVSVDDHYGHNYTVENMAVSRVSIAGGGLKVKDCVATKGDPGLVFLRGDTPYADGDLIIENCKSNTSLLYINVAANPDQVTTPLKFWDNITIRNSACDNLATESQTAMIRIDSIDTTGITKHKTKRVTLNNIEHVRHEADVSSGIFTQPFGFEWIGEFYCDNARLFDLSGSTGSTFETRLIGFRWLICDRAEFYRCKHLSLSAVGVGELSITDTLVGHPASAACSVSGEYKDAGLISLEGARLTKGVTLLDNAHLTARIVLNGCILEAPLTWSSTNNTAEAISALIANIAEDGVDLGWAPSGVFNYVKAGVYKTS